VAVIVVAAASVAGRADPGCTPASVSMSSSSAVPSAVPLPGRPMHRTYSV
jgi:hypothetical protein